MGMGMSVCVKCGKEILDGPVIWNPLARTATPFTDRETLPRRSAGLHVQYEVEGLSLLQGEPRIVRTDDAIEHIRCHEAGV